MSSCRHGALLLGFLGPALVSGCVRYGSGYDTYEPQWNAGAARYQQSMAQAERRERSQVRDANRQTRWQQEQADREWRRYKYETDRDRLDRQQAERRVRQFRNRLNMDTFAWERDHPGEPLPRSIRQRREQLERMEADYFAKYKVTVEYR